MGGTDLETVRKLAELARLALSPEEEHRLAPELGRLLAAFEVLAQHASIAPAAPAPATARTRGDQPLPSLPRDALLAPAAATEDGFFRVPKTVGGER